MRSPCSLGAIARDVTCPRDGLFPRHAFSIAPAERQFPIHLTQILLALHQERFQVVRPEIGIIKVAFIESEKLKNCTELRVVRKERAIYVAWSAKPHDQVIEVT